jgi:histidine triad (HIT) family protein
MECIFCAIVAGDMPAATIYEDANTMAFLDIAPLAKGHALVIPRTHALRLSDVSSATAGELMVAVQAVTKGLHAALGTTDATIAIHDGPAAGQDVPHLHAHIVPRTSGDGGAPIHALFSRQAATPDAIAALAVQVRTQLENP